MTSMVIKLLSEREQRPGEQLSHIGWISFQRVTTICHYLSLLFIKNGEFIIS